MRIYNLILILFTLLFIETTNEERKISGIITYNFVENGVSTIEKEKSKELHGFLDKMNEASKGLTFNLEFNNEQSLFYLNEVMESDKNPMAVSYVNNIVSRGKYYYSKSEDLLLRQEGIYGNNTLVKSISSEINDWKLTNESKKIGKYQCYKAIRTKTKVSSTKTHQFTVEAWYCPEIAVNYGPKEFNGLPGLILELKDTHYTFYAQKVMIQHDTVYHIKPLTSKNIITLKEHSKRMKKTSIRQ